MKAYRNATEVAKDEALANLLDRPREGSEVIAAAPTTKHLRRWQRWCIFGWAVAALLCILVFASTYHLSRSVVQSDRTAADAQAVAQKHLVNVTATQLRLRIAEDRLTELGIALEPAIGESGLGEYTIHHPADSPPATRPDDDLFSS